jgi:predicted RNA-binding Zn-ribbon protein involved in translation (DUF1610 family)
MTKIRATCPTCGNVEFGVESIVVLGSPETSVDDRSAQNVYRFQCPTCIQPVLRQADPEIIELLLSVGVALEGRDLALERVRPEAATLPAFTLADVDRLRDAMNENGWMDRFFEFDR